MKKIRVKFTSKDIKHKFQAIKKFSNAWVECSASVHKEKSSLFIKFITTQKNSLVKDQKK